MTMVYLSIRIISNIRFKMESAKQLAERFKDVILEGLWIARTNFKNELTQSNIELANTKISSLNTIALLTFHINYYIHGVLNVFKGGSLDIRDKFSFDAPPINTEEEWQALQEALYDNAQQFYEHVLQMSEEKLASNFVKKDYGSYRRNIEGMIEHCYYHLGQVAIIRKMILEES